MVCNLKLKKINGRLAAPVGDLPPLPVNVVKLRFVGCSCCRLVVRAVLSGGISGNKVIVYTIDPDRATGRLHITARTGRSGDIRYQPCNTR
jgi:hypothetical protein